MKTYVLDLDGVPALAFRAKDDTDAASWTGLEGPWLSFTDKRGDKLTVRPATIPERARWTAESILTDDQIEEGKVDPDSLVVSL